MAISLVIAFVRGWMLTLICLSTFPLMIAAQYFQVQFIAGVGADTNKVRIQSLGQLLVNQKDANDLTYACQCAD